LDEDVALELRRADVIFGCTDNHWSRTILNAIAYQYYVPLIDMGNQIDSDGERIRSMAGRVSIVHPGKACLLCSGVIDPQRVTTETLSATERESLEREGYVAGLAVANPAVISLNTVVAGLAVTELLKLVTGETSPRETLLINAPGPLGGGSPSHKPRCQLREPSRWALPLRHFCHAEPLPDPH
jgi:molybdopterin/thiamine biosynthesis adenylyltransferase